MCVGCIYVLRGEAVCPEVREKPHALRSVFGMRGESVPWGEFRPWV